MKAIREDLSAKDAVARLDAFVAESLKAPVDDSDRKAVLNDLGFMLGLMPVSETLVRVNPYFVAFSAGRRLQMGIDSAKLKAALEALKDDDLRKAETQIFSPKARSAAVVRPKK